MARRIRGQLVDGLLELLEEPILGMDRSGAVRFFSGGFEDFYPDLKEGELLWDCLGSDPLVRWVSDCLDSTTPEVREQIMTHRPEVLWLARLDPVLAKAGRCSGWILRLKDIQPVERLSERLDTLLGEVRQGLSAPLAGMKSRLEVLLEGGHEEAELRVELLRQINEDSNQLARLLFSLETPDQQKAPELPSDVSTTVESVANRVHQTFEPLARAKNLALKLKVEGHLDAVESVSEDELERCLVNMVDNAIKYTALNGYGEVVLACTPLREGAPGVLLSVDDSGPGIPAEHREAVFEQFFRIPDGPTAQLGGTGLGLWRVSELARERGGKSWVEDSPKGGAGLRLWFPYEK